MTCIIVNMMAGGGVRMDEFKSYDVFKNIFDSLCSYLTDGRVKLGVYNVFLQILMVFSFGEDTKRGGHFKSQT